MINQQIFLEMFSQNISQMQQKTAILLLALRRGKIPEDLPEKEEYNLAKKDCLLQLEYLLNESPSSKLEELVKSLKVSLLGFESALRLEREKDASRWGGQIVLNTISILGFLERLFGLKAKSKTSTVAGIKAGQDRLVG